jgi:hypothetical protein
MRSLAATLVLCSLVLVTAGWADAAPPPPPAKFWTVSRCERVLHAYDYALPTADGHRFHVGQRVCVATGGPHTCKWTFGHTSRLYSGFTVFTRSRYIGGVVRSWTLATRGGHGLVGMWHRAGDWDAGWPPDFYMSPVSVNLLATNAAPARFRSIVAPMAALLTQQENATGCTGG